MTTGFPEEYQEPVAEQTPYLLCDTCGVYAIEPVHGHFVCPNCHHQTCCCEGTPSDD